MMLQYHRTPVPTLIAVGIVLLTAGGCATAGSTFQSGVGDELLEDPPYYAGAVSYPVGQVAHVPIAYQPGASQAAMFDPDARPDSPITALLVEMNAYLDSLGVSTPLPSAVRGTAPDVRFGCDRDHTTSASGRATPPPGPSAELPAGPRPVLRPPLRCRVRAVHVFGSATLSPETPMSRLRALSDELRHRQVYRVAAVYAGVAFVIVQVAELFLPRLGLPDWTVTVLVMASVVGFPVAVALAWAFEKTPDGVRRAPATPGSPGSPAARPPVRVAAALLVAVAILAAGGSWIVGTVRPAALGRLAVLPLVNLASDPGQDYFAAGMHEALISELARAGVPVLAATAVRQFAGSPTPPREIGAQLGVDRLIEASVLRVGDSVRVQVRLVEATTQEHLWARTYDGELRDVLGLHRQLTREIADAVEVTLTTGERERLGRSRRVDPEVYDEYLRGMHALNAGRPDGPAEAIRHLRGAIDLDAADPLPYAGLAKVYATIGHSVVGTSEDLDRAKAAADQALRLEPDQPLAHAVLAEILFYRDWDIRAAGTAFRRALALDPSQAATHANYAWWLQLTGDLDEGIAEIRRAETVDPLMPVWPAWNAWLQWWAGVPPGELVPHGRRALELVPEHPMGLAILTFLLAASGQTDAAIAAGERARAAGPLGSWPLAFAYAHAGRRDEALALLEQLETDPRGPVYWGMAEVYAALGETDRAVRSLERAYEQRFNWMIWAATAPTLAPLRDDPRFQDLVRRVGWPPRNAPAVAEHRVRSRTTT